MKSLSYLISLVTFFLIGLSAVFLLYIANTQFASAATGLTISLTGSSNTAYGNSLSTSGNTTTTPDSSSSGTSYPGTMMCTMQYDPVCATYVPNCLTAPCEPVRQTYSNSCIATSAGAKFVHNGQCRPNNSVSNNRRDLRSGIWNIVSLNGSGITSSGTLSFNTSNKYSAKFCNSMNGRYTAFLSRLILRNTISTDMYCESDIMLVENAMTFRQAWYKVTSENLIIVTKNGDTIMFDRK